MELQGRVKQCLLDSTKDGFDVLSSPCKQRACTPVNQEVQCHLKHVILHLTYVLGLQGINHNLALAFVREHSFPAKMCKSNPMAKKVLC